MTTGLDSLRTSIDAIDDQLLELMARRRRVVREVGETKGEDALPLRSERREVEVLDRLVEAGRELGLAAHVVTQVFNSIIGDSVELQATAAQQAMNPEVAAPVIRVAYQGGDAAYSDQAARRYFGDWEGQRVFMGCSNFADVVAAVEEGAADYGLLPIENTTAGSIHEVQDLLLTTRLSVVGETVLEVDHCLIGLEETSPTELTRVLSHPQALTQCSRFLSSLATCHQEAYEDTALAVKAIRDVGDPRQGAIAGEAAARRYGLKVIRRGISNQKENFTRFLVLSPVRHEVDPRLPAKTSIILGTADHAGALLDALSVLRHFEINLSKLESRPRLGSPFEYSFYLEFEGRIGEARIDQALEKLRPATRFLRVLGSFPRFDAEASAPSREVLAAVSKRPESTAPPSTPKTSKPSAGYELVRREANEAGTVIRVRDLEIGEGFFVIAGPCSVESEDQIRQCAAVVREHGGGMLRGGCFKPRTSPYSFQGLGFEGVELLAAAGREFGLPTVTEVLAPADVARVAESIDVLQIGARNMQNYTLLSEAGRVDVPVILKRGLSASLDELLYAAEYILAEGNQRVILCERGIRTFETSTRNTLDLGAVALLKQWTHLPIIVDPSHAAGRRELVTPLAIAAQAVGPHGVMVEIHPEPEKALSDGPQALRPEDYSSLMERFFA